MSAGQRLRKGQAPALSWWMLVREEPALLQPENQWLLRGQTTAVWPPQQVLHLPFLCLREHVSQQWRACCACATEAHVDSAHADSDHGLSVSSIQLNQGPAA